MAGLQPWKKMGISRADEMTNLDNRAITVYCLNENLWLPEVISTGPSQPGSQRRPVLLAGIVTLYVITPPERVHPEMILP